MNRSRFVSLAVTAALVATAAGVAQQPTAAVETTNGLGLDLYRQLAAARPGENLFLSPWSVANALAMVTEGARDETLAEMRRVLHASDPFLKLSAMHSAFASLTRALDDARGNAAPEQRERIEKLRAQLSDANHKAEELQRARKWEEASDLAAKAGAIADQVNQLLPEVDRFDMRTANALWAQHGYALVPEFVATLARYYESGAVRDVDFRGDTEAARVQINDWIAQHTEHRIENMIAPGNLSPDTRLVLSNAVWFRGEWASPFQERATEDADFLLAAGGTAKVRMMHDAWRHAVPYAAFEADGSAFATPDEVPVEATKQPRTYPRNDGFTMVELPYKGDRLAMLVISPRSADGLCRIEKLLTAETLAAWTAQLRARTVDTALPKFRLACEAELSETLKALGMRRAFTNPMAPDGAQFGGISAATDPTQQLYISRVLHKAWVDVGEKGTEAAAATVIDMRVGATSPQVTMVPFVPVFRADRPFLFAIRDRVSGALLFVGRVLTPQS